VKAIDMRDPLHRKSNSNKDLSALGLGNTLAGILGGLPMISEVARSSANVNNGGKTRWSNFFHGFFMLVFLLLAVQFSDIIPKPALSAMLIGVGIKLAHPNEFKHMLKVGRDQLFIFILTIVVTLATDLLLGILAGIVLKLVLEISKGLRFSEIFKASISINNSGNTYEITAQSSLVFSNYISLMNQLQKIPKNAQVKLYVSKISMIDHSTMENLHHLVADFKSQGGHFEIIGLDSFIQLSRDPLSVRINKDIKK
jgi:MFS superfamily sulfate permease-like transporter